jgi:hypothetical protein
MPVGWYIGFSYEKDGADAGNLVGNGSVSASSEFEKAAPFVGIGWRPCGGLGSAE